MKDRTHDDILDDMADLLESCRTHENLIPGLEPWRDALGTVLSDAQAKKQQQAHLTAEKCRATRELGIALQEGLDLARRLRTGIKAQLGSRDPRLANFRIKPLKPRAQRSGT
jgi:hypothetical protein